MKFLAKVVLVPLALSAFMPSHVRAFGLPSMPGGGGIPPRRPQPGGGPTNQLMLEPSYLQAFQGDPQGTNVVEIPAIEVSIADEKARRLGMTEPQDAAYQRVLRRR